MDCEYIGRGITISGNFAEVLPEKPADFDYMRTGKWMADYPFDIRERIGEVICSCKRVQVNYAPYYGMDYYHGSTCNLMRQVKAFPHLMQLWAYEHLPAIGFNKRAVPADQPVPVFIRSSSRKYRIKVHVRTYIDRQATLSW